MTRPEIKAIFDDDGWYDKYGKPIVDLLIAEPNGRFTLVKLTGRMGFPREIALEATRKLSLIEMIDNSRMTGAGYTIYEASDAALKSVKDRRYRPQQRLCLGCESMFFSSHSGNRMCVSCRSDKEAIAA